MKTPRTVVSRTLADRLLRFGSSKKLDREVAAYLLLEHRVGELDSLLRDIQADWAAAGYVEVIAASAYPLSQKVKADIKHQMKKLYPTAQQVLISEVHDPEIIGGVRLNLANQQLDLSVEAKLHKFKQLTTAGKD